MILLTSSVLHLESSRLITSLMFTFSSIQRSVSLMKLEIRWLRASNLVSSIDCLIFSKTSPISIQVAFQLESTSDWIFWRYERSSEELHLSLSCYLMSSSNSSNCSSTCCLIMSRQFSFICLTSEMLTFLHSYSLISSNSLILWDEDSDYSLRIPNC